MTSTHIVNYKIKKKINDSKNIKNRNMRKKFATTKNVNYCNYTDEAYKKYYLTNFKDKYKDNTKLKNYYLGKKTDFPILSQNIINYYNLKHGENQISIIDNILSQSCKSHKILKNLIPKNLISKIDTDIYIPNLYTNFKSIHFYFTNFCYFMKGKNNYYSKLENLVKKCKNTNCKYLEIIEDNIENLTIEKKKTFSKILEYMHKYNYRLVPSSKYITDKITDADFHKILNKSNTETQQYPQNITQNSQVNSFSAFILETLYNVYRKLYVEIYKSIVLPIAKEVTDKILDEGIKIAFFESLSAAKLFFNSLKDKSYSVKGIINILSSENNKRLIGEYKYFCKELNRCITKIDEHINVWTSNTLKHGLVVYRGTDPREEGRFDIKTDLDISFRKTNENVRVILNKYIYNTYIYKELKEKYITTFAGHSLGGLIARNINRNIKEEITRPYLVITYNHFSDKSITINNEFHIYTKYDYASKGTIYNNNLNDILYYNSNWRPFINTNFLSNHSLIILEPLFDKINEKTNSFYNKITK